MQNVYGKCPKISNTLYHTFLPKFCCCFFMHLFLKILGGKANSVFPNQTAP